MYAAAAALLAGTAAGQTIHVEKTGAIGRRVETRYFVADLSPQKTSRGEEDSGTLRGLTYKEFGVTFLRDPGNGRMHKGQSIQRVGAPSYKDLGNWSPVQTFREEQKDGVYIHHREGYFPGYPEVKMEAEYRFPADKPYFFVHTLMSVEKPMRAAMLRNNEMTMNLFFTHVAWPGRGGQLHVVAFDERKPVIEKDPIPADVPWLAFVNLDKGYGYGFVMLESKASKTANSDTWIADGTVSNPGPDRPVTARYWSRHLVWQQEVDLVPGDRFEEETAYVLFHSSKDQPVRELIELAKQIRTRK